MALSVKLYRVVGKGKDRRYIPIDLGRRGRRSKEEVTGPFYLRYGVKYESVGPDFKAAVEAMQRRQATLEAAGSGVAVKPDGDPNRKRVADEVKKFLAKKSLLKDPKTVKTYAERLGYFLDWCERSQIKNSTPSFEVIESLASEFQTTLTATAIRYVQLRGEKCAVVCSTNREVSWFWPSPDFHYWIKRGKKLRGNAYAIDFSEKGVATQQMQEIQDVPRDSWIDGSPCRMV